MLNTGYKIKKFDDSSWVQVVKNGKNETLCMDEDAALQSIWVLEDEKHDHFYTADKNGIVSRVNRDT